MILHPDGTPELQPAELKAIRARIKKDGLTRVLAEEITKSREFAFDAGERLHVYDDRGVYRDNGKAHVGRRITTLLKTWGRSKSWRAKLVTEVADYIQSEAPKLWDTPPLNIVNVRNGLLNVETGELLPHTPKHLSPIQIPVRFDPKALCPAWDAFLSEVVSSDQIDALWELLGITMVPDRSIQQVAFLIGSPGTGKSTLLDGIKAFVGGENLTAMGLNRLETNRFAPARLLGKLANIAADITNKELRDVSIFKSITGGDAIEGEVKFKTAFTFTPYCTLIFSANHYPQVSGDAEAFLDRCYIIPMERRFRRTTEEVSRRVLAERLADPRELSGVLNKALPGLSRLLARGRYPDVESARVAMAEMRDATDQVAQWLEKNTERVDGDLVSQKRLVDAYNLWAREGDHPTILSRAMSEAVKRTYPGLPLIQRTYHRKSRVWCWVGLNLLKRSRS